MSLTPPRVGSGIGLGAGIETADLDDALCVAVVERRGRLDTIATYRGEVKE
jgi:hypothetical protein